MALGSIQVVAGTPTALKELSDRIRTARLRDGCVNASSPSGGGPITQNVALPVPLGFSQAVTISVTATNPSGTSARPRKSPRRPIGRPRARLRRGD